MSGLVGFRRQFRVMMSSRPESEEQYKAFLAYLEHRDLAAVATSTGLDEKLVKQCLRGNRWRARARTYDALCRRFREPLKVFVPMAMGVLADRLLVSVTEFKLADYSQRDFVLLAGSMIEVLDVLLRRWPHAPSARPD